MIKCKKLLEKLKFSNFEMRFHCKSHKPVQCFETKVNCEILFKRPVFALNL